MHALSARPHLLRIFTALLFVALAGGGAAWAQAPQVLDLVPADGALLASGQGTLTGRVTDATSLSVDGAAVTLAGDGSFSWAFDLGEGPTALQLHAEGPGGTADVSHTLVVDTRSPGFQVAQPSSPTVGASPVTVSGTYQEPHLESITVTGTSGTVTAMASGGSFSASLALVEGPQTVTVTARDTLGHEVSAPVLIVLDSVPPTIAITESGTPFAPGVYGRTVVPQVTFTDATELSTETTLNGAPFASGTSIETPGAHVLAASATDAAGHTTTASVSFTIDLEPPTLDLVTPPAGTVVASATVDVAVTTTGATAVKVSGVAATGGGPWTVTLPLVEGEQEILVEAFDDAGHRAERRHRIVRDTQAPAITIEAPTAGDVVQAATITVAGTASDPRLLEVRVDGQLANLVGETFRTDGVALVEGSNTLGVTATDSVGNTSTAQVTVTRDSAAPTFRVLVDGTSLVSGTVFSGPVTPVIEVDDPGASVSATLDGAAFISGATVSASGSHELSVTVTGSAGVSASTLRVFVIDSAAPVFGSVAPADGSVQSAAEVTLSGTMTGAVEVTVDDTAASLHAGSWSFGPIALAEGERQLDLVATGRNGLTTQQIHRVVRDATAPSLSVTAPADDGLVGMPSVDVTGTAADPHLDAVEVSGVPAQVSGSTFLARAVPLQEGSNLLSVRAVDVAGNASEATRTVVVDTQVPEIAITDPASGTSVPGATYTLRGTVVDAHLDRIEVSGPAGTATATVAGDGTWSAAVSLADGHNALTARAVDRLGRDATATITLLRDADAPPVAIVVPSEGASTSAATIEVRGTVEDVAGTTVSLNGQAAVIDRGSWSVTDVPLAVGENRLVARATDAQGNQGTHTRTVIRDTAPPTFEGSDPSSGALSVPVGSTFRLRFSEPMAAPEDGSWTLETSTATPVPADASIEGDDLVLTPTSPLPPSTDLVLTLTALLTDRAGNALAPVPAPLVFTTADTGAPAAPTLDPWPSALCASTMDLAGTADPGTRVRVDGGASAAEVRVGADGAFALTVTLVPESLNRLELTSSDVDGDASPPAVAEVTHDCTAPRVTSAELSGQEIAVVFSEAVDPATVAPAVAVTDGSGSVSTTVSVSPSNDAATVDLGAVPSSPIALEVGTQVVDAAGNALAFPYRRLFGDAAGDSFFAGTVIDEATGRPLEGAVVQVTARDGTPLTEPLPRQTTAADGRFLLASPAGTHDVTIARPGYAPAFRAVTTQAGQGTNVFDPRLVPLAEATTIPTTGGVAGIDARLDVPSGALAQATDISVTALPEQGLPALLPYGWSPRGGAWVELDIDLLTPSTLTLPVESPNGTVLDVVALDFATLQWNVVSQPTVASGGVTVSVSTVGVYVAVEADTGLLSPPPAVVGQVLGSSPTPVGDEVTSATIAFEPAVVLPTQTADATVTYVLAADLPSGLALTLSTEEELELLDGTVRREAPYPADLVLYRGPSGDPRSRFSLRPSTSARTLPVRLGSEQVTLRPYGEETVRGNVLGPEGGAVVNDQGDQLDVPSGSLDGPTAVVLRRGTVADLPLAAPTAGTVAGVVTVDLGGAVLAAGGSLRLSTPPPDPAARGLLLHVYEVDGSWAWRVVGEIEPTASGWSTKAVDPLDLLWPGVRSGGAYLFFEPSVDVGFVRGTIFDADSQPLPAAVVDADVVEWIQISNADGSYALPLTLAAAVVTARHPTSGDSGSVSVTVPAADARVDLDLQLQVVAPWVVEVSPADAAVDVPLGIEPTVRFSEPVERASLAAGVELVRVSDGSVVAVELDHQGDLVRLLPSASLEPGAGYEIRVTTSVRDLDGHALPNPLTTSFTTQDDPDGTGRLDRSKVALIAPGPDGLALVDGAAGAAPADALVYVENLTSFVATESVQAGQDGSFQVSVGAALGDRLLLHVLIEGSSADLMVLGPYLSSDRRAAWAPVVGASWTTADGLTLTVEEGTFDAGTWVRAQTRSVAQAPVATPDDFTASLLFDLDFGGAQPTRPLRVRLPASSPDPSATHVLARHVEALGLRGWMVHSLPRVDGGALTDEPEAGAQGVVAAVERSTAPRSTRYSTPERYQVLTVEQMQARRAGTFLPGGGLGRPTASPSIARSQTGLQAVTGRYLGDPYLPGLVSPGTYQAMSTNRPVTVITLPVHGPDLVAANTAIDPPFLSVITSEILSLLTTPVFTLLGWQDESYALEVHDLATGYTLYDGLGEAPAVPFLELPSETYGDTEHPILLGGSPIRFFHLQTSTPQTFEVAPGVTVDLGQSTENRLRVTGADGAAAASAEVKVLNYESEVITATRASASGSFQLDAPFEPGQRFLLAIGGMIRGAERAEVRFSEPLASANLGFGIFEVGDNGQVGAAVALDGTTPDGGSTLHVRPTTGWRKGTYRLRIDERLADAGNNAWPTAFEIDFEVTGSAVLSTTAVPHFADMASLGDLLFVASGDDGLRILDASHPKVPRPYLGVDKGYPIALGDPVRGVDVDAHGRVFFTGGGVKTSGQIKILDPLAIDPSQVTDEASADDAMAAAYRGSTVISDPPGGGTWLPEGHPFRVATLTNDRVDRWRIGTEAAPADLALAPAVLDAHGRDQVLTLSAGGEAEGYPVSVRNLTRGRFRRTEAAADGSWTLQIEVEPGDLIELRRNVSSHAYVAVQGAGIAATHVAGFWDVDLGQPNTQAVEYLPRYPVEALPVCDANRPNLSPVPFDLAALVDPSNAHPAVLVTLIQGYGPALQGLDLANPAAATRLGRFCGAVDGVASFGGLAVLPAYASDTTGDGKPGAPRDYVLVTHAKGYLLIYDVTDRHSIRRAGSIRLVADATGMEFGAVTVDPRGRRAYVAAAGAGLFVIDLDRPESDAPTGSGVDPRVLERLEIPGEDVAGLLILPESGVAFAGGRAIGLTGVRLGAPMVELLGADGGPLRRVARLAPFGVPTGPETRGASTTFPGVVRLRAVVPGLASNASQAATPSSLAFDLLGLGPGGLPADDAGDLPDLPTTRLDAVELRRQATNAWEEGHRVYLSDPIVLLADVRASVAYSLSAGESDVCDRCDPVAEGVYVTTPTPTQRFPELLSGHTVGARFADAHAAQLEAFYEDEPIQGNLAELPSVPWDIGPSVRQEPAQSSSFGLGDVAPGTLLHSGEVTHTAVDLALRGLGFDFAFTRTYRSQTVGAGPLGPGWDHGYRVRLRELPDGSVDLFDGRGRRERFEVDANDELVSPPGVIASLKRTAGGGWVLTDAGGNRHRFDRFGRLLAISDALFDQSNKGTRLDFSYDAASRLTRVAAHGRFLDFVYDEGILKEVRDSTGRQVDLVYTAGRLTSVRLPEAELGDGTSLRPTTEYAYASASGDLARRLQTQDNLETITDPRGVEWLRHTYEVVADGRGDVVRTQRWGDLGTPTIDIQLTPFGPTGTTATVTDRRGHRFVYEHTSHGHLSRYVQPADDGTSAGPTYTWEYHDHGIHGRADGLVEAACSPSGLCRRMTLASPSPRTAPERRADLQRVELLFSGTFSHGLAEVGYDEACMADPSGLKGSPAQITTSFADHHGRTGTPERIIGPAGRVLELALGDRGRPEASVTTIPRPGEDSQIAATSFEANAFGQIEGSQFAHTGEPAGTIASAATYAPGAPWVTRVTADAGGLDLTTTYQRDARGNVLRLEKPGEVVDSYRYNALDWVLEACLDVTGLNSCTAWVYDAAGQVVEVHQPYGTSGISRTEIDHGPLGEVEEIRTEVSPGGPILVETRDYDANLNLVEIDPPNRAKTTVAYDPRNRPTETTDAPGTPLERSESFAYDADGRVTQVTDAAGYTWSTRHDVYGRAMRSEDPLGNFTLTSYDALGQPTSVRACSSEGELLSETRVESDGAGRPQRETRTLWREGEPATELTWTYSYDNRSQLMNVQDPDGNIWRWRYDRLGTVILEGSATVGDVRTEPDYRNRSVTTSEQTSEGTRFPMTVRLNGLGLPETIEDAQGRETQRAYDRRGQLVLSIDPDDDFTSYAYDALGRPLRATQPEGIEVTWSYVDGADTSSVIYRDVLGNETTYHYDELGQLGTVEYPDGALEAYAYDPRGPEVTAFLPSGPGEAAFQIRRELDGLGRPLVRRFEHDGVEVRSESYQFDGLSRVRQITVGGQSTQFAYDSLSRRIRQSQLGLDLGYGHDARGLVTSIAYPSSLGVEQDQDGLGRLGEVRVSGTQVAGYGFAGLSRWASKTLGSLAGSYEYSPAGDLETAKFQLNDDPPLYDERLTWTPKGLRESQSRVDLGGRVRDFGYDKASRLTTAIQDRSLFGEPLSWTFGHDAAQNLTSMVAEGATCSETRPLPVAEDGRNRPASVSGKALEWNARGQLVRKGDQTFEYDLQGRLLAVRENGALVASYAYDPFHRRVERTVGGRTWRTAWDGWRPVEEYEITGGQTRLASRRVYGQGLDEIVRLELDANEDGTLEVYRPMYDSIGSLVQLLAEDGTVVERYAYGPFGERYIETAGGEPTVEQIRVEGGQLILELDRPLDPWPVDMALGSASLYLQSVADSRFIALAATQPTATMRRLVLSPSNPETAPTAGESVHLVIPSHAFRDLFGKVAAVGLSLTFAWPADGSLLVVDDTAAPKLEEVCVEGGTVKVTFSEVPDPLLAAVELRVNGQAASWHPVADGYGLELSSPLQPGSHSLDLGTGPLDLLGQEGLAQGHTWTFDVDGNGTSSTLYGGASVSTSAVGNHFGFHGLQHDEVTGFIYARNRYLDPEMGRFLTTDPLGYVDGPNLYQFALNNPVNFSDPMGLESIRQALDVDEDLVDNPALGIAKWYGYQFWNIFTMGFLEEHDEVYEQYSGGEYVTKTALATGKAGTKLYVAVQTGGAGLAFGEAAGLSLLTTSALTGSAVGTSVLATDDLFNLAEGKPTHSLGDYGKTAAIGGALGLVAGGLAQRAGTGSASMSRGAQLRQQYGSRFTEYMRFRQQGFTPRQSQYLTKPYGTNRMGHHFIPRRTGGRLGIPRSYMESPLNKLQPRGISIGRFYELHFKADPYFWGTRFPSRIGGTWQGRALGFEKAGQLGRLWYASPRPFKLTVGGGLAGGGAASYWWLSDDD